MIGTYRRHEDCSVTLRYPDLQVMYPPQPPPHSPATYPTAKNWIIFWNRRNISSVIKTDLSGLIFDIVYTLGRTVNKIGFHCWQRKTVPLSGLSTSNKNKTIGVYRETTSCLQTKYFRILFTWLNRLLQYRLFPPEILIWHRGNTWHKPLSANTQCGWETEH